MPDKHNLIIQSLTRKKMKNKPPKIVLLNAPPRSGKDTLLYGLHNHFDNATIKSYAAYPKKGTHASLGIDCDYTYYEGLKDTPLPEFFGDTPRQAYIKHAEQYMKPLYGNDVYARIMANVLGEHTPDLTLIADLGFQEEYDALLPVYGAANILIIYLHREGYTYERYNDSRRKVKPANEFGSWGIINEEGNVDHMIEQAISIIESFIKS